MLEIDYDDLDVDENHTYFFEGNPFTGVAIERTSEGMTIARTLFVSGFKEGLMSLWYPCGQLKMTVEYHNNMAHGRFVEYSQDGRVLSEGENEHGVCLWRKLHDPDGMLIEDYTVESNEAALTALRIARKAFTKKAE